MDIDLTTSKLREAAYRRRQRRLELIIVTSIWLFVAAALAACVVARIVWNGPNWVW